MTDEAELRIASDYPPCKAELELEQPNHLWFKAERNQMSNIGTNNESRETVSQELDRRPTLRTLRATAEAEAITQALNETAWNRKRAAQILSISYRGLLYKIQQYNITPSLADGWRYLPESKVKTAAKCRK